MVVKRHEDLRSTGAASTVVGTARKGAGDTLHRPLSSRFPVWRWAALRNKEGKHARERTITAHLCHMRSPAVAAPPCALCHGAPGAVSMPCRPDFLGLQDHDRGMREKGVPDDLAKTRLVQDGLIRGLRPIIVADIHRTTACEHRHVERDPGSRSP
jgi:hypothetical protein